MFTAIALGLSLAADIAQAEDWVYLATLPTRVQVYVDLSSVNTVSTNPLIKTATVSLGRSGSESETITIQAACAVKGIRTRSDLQFSTTQADQPMGRLVTQVCYK